MAISAFPYTAVLDVSANSILGNNTGSPAAAIALTATQVRSLLSVYTSAQVDALLAGYQPLDANLTAIAALTTTSFGRSLLTQADAAATRTTIDAAATSHTHAASDITSGVIATARLASSGTASATTYLRGDQTWATVSAGISSLNGLTDATQTFAVGTTGTDVAFSSAAGVHTLNVPSASATARGVVTTGTQTFAGIKTFSTADIRLGTGANDYRISTASTTLYIDNNTGNDTQFRQGAAGTQCSMNTFSPHFRTLSLSIGSGTASQTVLQSRSSHILEQRSGTNAQRIEIYNTYTSATSFERLNIGWSGSVCIIETEKGSAGGTLQGLRFGGASTSLLGFYGATPVDRPDTVADPAGGGTIDAEARTAINAIIDRLQELGLIA